MPFPTPIVEIAFDDGPYVLNPTWTDVTSWVYRMDIDRGRSDDWGEFNSFASVTFNNRTRRFDPYFTTGPYFGKLLPRKQIRIRATHGGTTYDVFRGFIDGWNPEWTDAGGNSTVTVSCFDALQLLASEQLPADWSRPYILSLNPRHYYPLDEPIVTATTTTLRDLGNFPQPLAATNAVSDRELAFGLPSRSVQIDGAQTTIIDDTTNRSFTVSMWANFGGGNIFYVGRQLVSMYFDNADGRFTADITDSVTSIQRRYKSTNTYAGGDPFMLTVTWNSAVFAATMYLNGTPLSTTVTTSTVMFAPAFEGLFLSRGQFQQVIVYHYELSPAQILNIYNLSDAIFPETTTARFNRCINESPFPAALTSAPASPASSVLEITNDASRISDELRITAASEGGPLFVSKNGTITMFQQKQIFSQTRSIVSQTTYGSGGNKLDPTVGITSDGDSMRNTVNVSMSGGGVLEKTNVVSANTYGVASMSLDTYVQTIAQAQALADLTTGFGGQVYPDLTPARVVISADNNWGPTLGLELMDRITVNIAPPTGNVISTPMLVQKIRHEVVPSQWVTTLEGSARWAAVFILNQSRLGGTDLLG